MNKPLTIMWLGLRGFPGVQGGVERHAEHLCPWLAELGCDVTVIVRSAYQPAEAGQVWGKVRYCRLPAPRSKHLEAIGHTLLGVLYAAWTRPDILHIHAIGPAMMVPLARLLGLRVVVTHHGPDYDRQKWGRISKMALRFGELCGMRHANARIAISSVIRELVRQRHNVDSVMIPNGVDIPEAGGTTAPLERFGLQPGHYILHVSRLVPEKNHLDLIAAFRQARIAGWKLALVGGADHPDAYTRALQQAAAASPDIVCTGFQTGTALQALYRHAGVFVLPSSHEGLPIAMLEAMSHGLPVIASDIPANLEVACSDIEYFPVGDVPALAKCLQACSTDKDTGQKRQRLRNFVESRYKWRDIAIMTHALYLDVVTGKVTHDTTSSAMENAARR